MLVDWFTVGAQALNFLILVWLMKHFLYQPILHAIDTREKKIAAELADADDKRAEAKKDRDEFQHKNEEFDRQRAALLAKATDEAKAERQRLLDEARKAADTLSAKRQESLRSDAKNLNQAIARRTQDEVFAIARKALTDLATTSLEERMGAVFTRRLRELDGKAKGALESALKNAKEPAVVRSAFDVPAEQRATIQNAINETFSADVPLRFETTPDRISGIELTMNGQKVAWSIADYLTSLEKGVSELLKQQDKPEPKPAPKPEAKPEPKAEPKSAAPVPAAPEAKGEPTAKAEPAPKPETEAKAKPTLKAQPDVAPKSEAQSTPAAKVESEAKPTVPAKAAPEVKTDPAPEPKPEAETKAKPTPEAEPKTAAKPEAEVKPRVIPVEPTKASPEVRAETPKPKTAATALPPPEAKAAPVPATPPEPTTAAGPSTETKAKPEAAEVAPVGS
jgi:F-type H+-transporting ATPase subunit b